MIGWSICLHLVGEEVNDVVILARPVDVPAPVEQLHVSDALFEQPPRQQTVIRKRCLSRHCTVRLLRLLRLARDIHDFRDRHLHPESQFVLIDSGQGFGIACSGEFLFVQRFQRIQASSSDGAVHPRRV